ncbi:HK97 family phage prohead protease [Nocardiopsis sp. FR26]|uniref:HK97 family phage prohead protease n=1 Tax=Nocardiopsis sp. FR26 TaxID=2605987 RepID=UPI0013572B74|nr:HK97 family phage prohead protease [Nocardiopsis sp. FR26]
MTVFTRSFPLEDISVVSDGDGRTVEAYAAVWDAPTEIRDADGHYMEVISRSAFEKTLSERGLRIPVLYNHGRTLHGVSSERGSVPIGTPLEIRADGRGLYTRTRYHKTPLADEVLEAIREGSIRGQSFSGRFIQSNPARVPRRTRGGELPTVIRTEIALSEYGPTPIPAYEGAEILGVRSLVDRLGGLSEEERAALIAALTTPASTTPEPGAGDDTDTPTEGAVTDEPTAGHSGPVMSPRHVRARLRKAGLL